MTTQSRHSWFARSSSRTAAAALVVVAAASCGPPPEPPPAAGGRLNVLVITLDTIRTDRLGAFGNHRVATPFVDGLAARGVAFDRCAAPAPLTLPSHTSLFTGTYPVYHGVRDNGSGVAPEQLETMAELFADAGYRTGAFVGAYVLAARWGLDQGFQTYREPASGYDPGLASFAEIQRRADAVVDDALAWLAEPSTAPFFAWVHLYDPHLPYDPPAPYDAEYPDDPYLGEVAFSDAQMARLGAFLAARGLEGETLVVFAGDHGEGLGDHGELDHGLLLYQTTVQVPLILAGPAADAAAGSRRPEVVSLVDILPTVTELAGLPEPPAVQGRSLVPLLRGGSFDERPVIAETVYPQRHFGWSPLASLQDRRYQLIRSSEPELYDLVEDPDQGHNLIASRPEVATRMTRELELLLARLGEGALDASHTPDAGTIARLEALGYLAGGVSPVADGLADDDRPSPVRMLWQYNLLLEASATVASGDTTAGEAKLRELVEANPDLVDAWVALGRLYRRQGRMAEALDALDEAHARRPLDPFLAAKLADAMIATGRLGDAEALLAAALDRHPDDPSMLASRGRVMESTGRLEAAERDFRRLLELDPASAPAHVRLAAIALQRGDRAAAAAELDAALRIDPRVPEASLFRGRLLEEAGRFDEAARSYHDELEANPASLPTALALSRLEGRRGRPDVQERVLRDAIRANPRSPGPYLVLAMTLLQRGERLPEAVELAERGLEQGPQGRELEMAYVILANLYQRLGKPDRAAAYVRLAEEAR